MLFYVLKILDFWYIVQELNSLKHLYGCTPRPLFQISTITSSPLLRISHMHSFKIIVINLPALIQALAFDKTRGATFLNLVCTQKFLLAALLRVTVLEHMALILSLFS